MLEMSEWVERQALVDMLRAAQEQGLTTWSEAIAGGVALRCPDLDGFLFNRVLGVGNGAPIERRSLAAVIEAYRSAAISRFFVHLHDNPQPAALPGWLEALGVVRYRRSWEQLGRGRDEPLPAASSTLCVRPAVVADGAALGGLFATAFDLPPAATGLYSALLGRPGWHVVVAAEGETIAGAGLLFIADGVAYLAGGATSPPFRRRGAQLSLMLERCRLALDAGCRWIASETGAPAPGDPQHSHHNMQRCGLRVLATRHNYAPRGVVWAHGQPG